MKIEKLKKSLNKILRKIVEYEKSINQEIKHVHPDYRLSAKNLLRYLILRTNDLRKYHGTLSDLGISSIRSSEGYVYSNLHNVLKILHLIDGSTFVEIPGVDVIGYTGSRKLLLKHTKELFREDEEHHSTRIMVTLPDEIAEDPKMINDMLLNGMEIARINLSHGNPVIWKKMLKQIRKAEENLSKRIKIYMDLSGPKIRTAGISIKRKNGKHKSAIPVKTGDHIILTSRETTGKRSKYDDKELQVRKAELGVSLPQLVEDAQIGDLVLFDDGMISARVVSKYPLEIELEILECYKSKIGSDKGINLPNTKLNLPALTQRDLELLPFVCQHADMVGYSFVRSGKDVVQLYEQLDKLKATELGVIFKIENKEAFEHLPDILLEGMCRNKLGVMIARGDLAVEIGFERISEVQNEILWICEAAHIPVIWATQVLDNMARTGIPTRAEISDASIAAQAECVMLNKGVHILAAIKVLRDILHRMEGHLSKKKNELRALNVAKKFLKRHRNQMLLKKE